MAACSSTAHMPAPVSPEAAGIAIRVKTRPPIRIVSQDVGQVLFVRLTGNDGTAVTGEAMPSNHRDGEYLLLLNATPGTYVAVASLKEPVQATPVHPSSSRSLRLAELGPLGLDLDSRTDGADADDLVIARKGHLSLKVRLAPESTPFFHPSATTYFPEDMIQATLVTVGAGGVAFMGDFVVDQSVGMEGADPTQLYFAAQFGGDKSMASNMLKMSFHYRGELHASSRDAEARADFCDAVNEHLIEAGWSPEQER